MILARAAPSVVTSSHRHHHAFSSSKLSDREHRETVDVLLMQIQTDVLGEV